MLEGAVEEELGPLVRPTLMTHLAALRTLFAEAAWSPDCPEFAIDMGARPLRSHAKKYYCEPINYWTGKYYSE